MENNLTYTQNGDYLIPDLRLSEQPSKPWASTDGCGKRTSRPIARFSTTSC